MTVEFTAKDKEQENVRPPTYLEIEKDNYEDNLPYLSQGQFQGQEKVQVNLACQSSADGLKRKESGYEEPQVLRAVDGGYLNKKPLHQGQFQGQEKGQVNHGYQVPGDVDGLYRKESGYEKPEVSQAIDGGYLNKLQP